MNLTPSKKIKNRNVEEMKNEIIIYMTEEQSLRLEVKLGEDSVWLTRQQIALLFDRDVKTIGKHINNIFSEGELEKEVVVAKFATTTQHGAIKGKTQIIQVEYYNLDVIISVGYRVKSFRGTQFRIWANNVLRDYLLKGYAVNNRLDKIEHSVSQLESKINGIDLQINTILPPGHGIYYDGQVFDAYLFVSGLIRSAKSSIVLIDNYINETVLALLTKRAKGVSAVIYTSGISKQLRLDIEKHNMQYDVIDIFTFSKSHDRFLIIDMKEIYHIGASLKDMGKKWFAFSKINLDIYEIITRLRKNI